MRRTFVLSIFATILTCVSVFAQTTAPADRSPTGYDLPGWAISVMIIIGGLAAVLTAGSTILWPLAFGIYKRMRDDISSVKQTAVEAKSATDVNTTRITNVSNQHSTTEQTITALAKDVGEAKGMATAAATTATAAINSTLPGGGAGGGAALIMLPFLIFVFGCVPSRTSTPYQIGVKPAVDLVAHEMSDYTAANKNLTPVAKAAEQFKTDALSATVADVKKIEAAKVQSAWAEVKPTYRNYVLTDSTLPTDRDKQDILRTSESIDTLNAQELGRQRDFFEALFTTPIFVPATQPAR